MASIFSFRSRDPARDKQTDLARFDRLAKLLDQIVAEIAAEKTGLEVGNLTKSILSCEQRIAELARQTSRMRELRHSLDAIVDENGQGSDWRADYIKSARRA